MFVKILRADNRLLLADRVEIADSFWRRLRGLMLVPDLPEGTGLLLSPCKQIHMMFMRFPIDAIFLNGDNRIVHCYHSLAPWWGISGFHLEAEKVLELPAGTAAKKTIQIGEHLLIENA